MAVIAALILCSPVYAQTHALTYNPVDAQYSTALDRIIMVSGNPNQLHIYDPISGTETTVGLPKPPLAVSVSPDGYYAAVGHDALISYVNLTAGTVQQQFPTPFTVTSLVLNTSWIYVLQDSIESINISSGAVTTAQFYLGQTPIGRLDPVLNTLYVAAYGRIGNVDISTGPMTEVTSLNYNYYYSNCPPLWLSQDGTRLYNGCGSVFQASADATQDMQYLSTLSTSQLSALADSAALLTVATIQLYCCGPVTDGFVSLYSSNYLQPAGQFTLPNFTAGGKSYAAHGKWVFFNSASTDLHVLMQADSSAGLANSFALQTFSMAAPSPCGATFNTPAAAVGSAGALGAVGLTATPACIYQASSNVSWLQIVSGGYGSGNGSLVYMARPNLAPSARTGTISMSGQTYIVTQDAASASPGAFTPLSYNPVGAAYDASLDKMILVASGPNELHIYDAISQADQVVPLPAVPLGFSVSPDGSHAAVGHDGWISYVDLQTHALLRIFPVNVAAEQIVLAGNGYVYFYSNSPLYWMETSSGIVSSNPAVFNYMGGPASIYTDGHSIYSSGYSFVKFDISQVTPNPITLTNSNLSTCGNFWISQDGALIFTACGTVYTASDVESQDLLYEGTLVNAGAVVWAAESSLRHSTAVIPNGYYNNASDTQLQMYGDTYLGYAGSLSLPQFTVSGIPYAGHGKFAFWNAASANLFVVEQADTSSSLLSSYAVAVISPYVAGSGCTFSLGSASATEIQSAGFDAVAVTAGANCAWAATSNAPWLTITSGAVGFGSGLLNFEFAANSGATRSAQLTIAGLPFTVTQSGIPCTYSVSPSAVYLDKNSQSSGVSVTANGSGCTWSAAAAGGFINITSGAAGSGNGTVAFTATANETGYLRTGSLTIAGKTVSVTQRETAKVFTDVNPPDYYFDFTDTLYTAGITSGCLANPPQYCPGATITRGEMAVYLVVAVEGSSTFSYTTTPYFTDVAPSNIFFRFIQKLRDLGITAGCSATQFCPDGSITRGEMAAFIIRSRYESTPYTYPATPYFTDVPASDMFFPFIQKMAQTGITAGCAPNLYCPDATLTRGQMAVFVVTGLLNELLAPGAPIIASAAPNTAAAGQGVQVTLTGINTHFAQGTTQVTAAPGITVASVNVLSATSLTVQLTVGAGVAADPTSIVVSTGTEEALLPNGFIVQ